MSEAGALVYLVDDDASVREGVARLIRSAGVMTRTFASAEEFLAASLPAANAAKKWAPSCLVLDVNLPGLSGLDLQTQLVKSGIEMPIIFLTGHGDIPMTVRAVKQGAVNLLTKPVDDEDLLNTIRQCLTSCVVDEIGPDQPSYMVGESPAFQEMLKAIKVGGVAGAAARMMREPGAGSDTLDEVRFAERTRIAQALHDTLLQGFFAASMQLYAAVESLPADCAERPRFRAVLQLLRGVLEEGRCAVQGLRAPNDRGTSLREAIARVPAKYGLPSAVGFRVIPRGGERELRAGARDEIYRIVCEAIVNACRHSKAKNIEAEIEFRSAELRLIVRDDGCGIDPQILERGRNGHWGLQGMRERAERIGARFQVLSRIEHGTEVELSVPGQIAYEPLDAVHAALKWKPGSSN